MDRDNTGKTTGRLVYAGKLILSMALVAVLTGAVIFTACLSDKKATTALRQADPAGAAVLESLAALDKGEVDRILNERHKNQDITDTLADPETNVWSLFRDYVILGDSRAVGFSYYRYLADERVIADGGNCVRDALDAIPAIESLAPSYIYIIYGLNDTGMGYWDTAEEYGAECVQILKKLMNAAPNAKITVSSTLPVTEQALSENPVWNNIPSFTAAMAKACEQTGAVYVDNTQLAEQYMDTLWDEDGTHLQREFYPLWAENLITGSLS